MNAQEANAIAVKVRDRTQLEKIHDSIEAAALRGEFSYTTYNMPSKTGSTTKDYLKGLGYKVSKLKQFDRDADTDICKLWITW